MINISSLKHKSLWSRVPDYTALKRAYHDESFESLCTQAANPIFARDGNAGLVKQVVQSWRRRAAMYVSKIYVTCSISETARKLGLKSAVEAERMVLVMVLEGGLKAKISQKDGR